MSGESRRRFARCGLCVMLAGAFLLVCALVLPWGRSAARTDPGQVSSETEPPLAGTLTLSAEIMEVGMNPYPDPAIGYINTEFDVLIRVHAGVLPVEEVHIDLGFETAYLTVSREATMIGLPDVMTNTYDNDLGRISVAASRTGDPHTGTFDMCRLHLRGVTYNTVGTLLSSLSTPLVFGPGGTPYDVLWQDGTVLVTGGLCVSAFYDIDADEVQDPDEPLLSGVVVELAKEEGPVVETYVTDGVSEPYCFEVEIGEAYVVTVLELPHGYFRVGPQESYVLADIGVPWDIDYALKRFYQYLPIVHDDWEREPEVEPTIPPPPPTVPPAP